MAMLLAGAVFILVVFIAMFCFGINRVICGFDEDAAHIAVAGVLLILAAIIGDAFLVLLADVANGDRRYELVRTSQGEQWILVSTPKPEKK